MKDFSYIASNSRVTNSKIGKYCSIGSDAIIGLGRHPSRTFVSSHPIFYSTACQSQISFVTEAIFDEFAPINIGNDVWIGTRAVILDGVTIGDGAIVGAGSVVTKDIPPYAIVTGIPATILRYRFDIAEITFLTELKWWDKDISWLRKNSSKFSNIKKIINHVTCIDR
jgi:acetyltransferase-like isoleucine patch superfamily enzyme